MNSLQTHTQKVDKTIYFTSYRLPPNPIMTKVKAEKKLRLGNEKKMANDIDV